MQKTDDAIYFDIPINITSPLEKKIAKVFAAFDHNAVNMVHARDVGAILRFLGCVPTEKEVEEIVKKTEFPDHPGDIHLSNFMKVLKEKLFKQEMKPSPPEVLIEAFRFFDPNNQGFIEKEKFIEIMKEFGEAMTDDELDSMLKASVSPHDQRVHFEFYLSKLIHEPEDSIYETAKSEVK